MATNSIFHNVAADTPESAKRLLAALEQAKRIAVCADAQEAPRQKGGLFRMAKETHGGDKPRRSAVWGALKKILPVFFLWLLIFCSPSCPKKGENPLPAQKPYGTLPIESPVSIVQSEGNQTMFLLNKSNGILYLLHRLETGELVLLQDEAGNPFVYGFLDLEEEKDSAYHK